MIKRIPVRLDKSYKGQRLDKVLPLLLEGQFSRSQLKGLFDKKLITGGKDNLKPSYRVKGDEDIVINLVVQEKRLLPWDYPLEIIYEDDNVAVINKPSGLLVHPAGKNREHTLVNALLYRFGALSGMDTNRPGIVHRLDKDTSGVMVVCLNDLAHRSISEQFSRRKIHKEYIALVEGVLKQDRSTIEVPIGRTFRDPTKFKVSFVKSKSAYTEYEVTERLKNATLVLLKPKTGRTHQLRVHLKFLGHPILGDPRYSKTKEIGRLCLHARRIGFINPGRNTYMEFSAELPEDFNKIIEKLRD